MPLVPPWWLSRLLGWRLWNLATADILTLTPLTWRTWWAPNNASRWQMGFNSEFRWLTLILLMWRKGWAPNSILIYIQQDATLHSLFISGNCSTYFGWFFHPSSGAHTPVFTASGICHTVTAICRYRGRVGTGLIVLWVAYARLLNISWKSWNRFECAVGGVRQLFHDSGR
jgi:hypothetical protein